MTTLLDAVPSVPAPFSVGLVGLSDDLCLLPVRSVAGRAAEESDPDPGSRQP